jgi:hypothetical protein
VVYDPDLDRLVAWGTSACLDCFYVADMDKALANAADTWTVRTVKGAPSPAIESDNHGINKRFNYWRAGRMYIYEGSVSSNMWAVRLASADNILRVKEQSGSSQTNRPVTIGRPFRQGEMSGCPEVWVNGADLLTQTDVKSRWPDGSLKFGIVSFVLPSLAGGGVTTSLPAEQCVSGACHNTGGLTAEQALGSAYRT